MQALARRPQGPLWGAWALGMVPEVWVTSEALQGGGTTPCTTHEGCRADHGGFGFVFKETEESLLHAAQGKTYTR